MIKVGDRVRVNDNAICVNNEMRELLGKTVEVESFSSGGVRLWDENKKLISWWVLHDITLVPKFKYYIKGKR